MLPAIAWALVSSTMLYLVSPRFPHYQVTSIRFVSFSFLHFLLTWRISCVVEVQVVIDNANFVGAQVHGTVVDMYYPNEKSRELTHLGYLQDKHNHHFKMAYEDVNVDADQPALAAPKNPTPLHLPPRKTILMHDNVITVQDLRPSTYMSIGWDAVTSGGTIDVLSAGVAHVKTTLLKGDSGKGAVPLTVTVLCDNRINTLEFPARIVERTCSPVEIFPTWLDVEAERAKLEKEISARYKEGGTVLQMRGGVDMLGGQKRDDPEAVENWHDF